LKVLSLYNELDNVWKELASSSDELLSQDVLKERYLRSVHLLESYINDFEDVEMKMSGKKPKGKSRNKKLNELDIDLSSIDSLRT